MLLCYRFVFEYQVEKEKVKQEMLGKWFGHDSSCLFGDITKMCENELRDDILLDPKKVKWKTTSWCRTHGKECCINLPHTGADTESMGVLGSPCQLFSKPLAWIGKQVVAVSDCNCVISWLFFSWGWGSGRGSRTSSEHKCIHLAPKQWWLVQWMSMRTSLVLTRLAKLAFCVFVLASQINRPWLFEQGQLKSSGQKIEKARPTPQVCWCYFIVSKLTLLDSDGKCSEADSSDVCLPL